MEFKSGVQVADLLPIITNDEARKVVSQIAMILASLHRFRIPPTVKGFGGLSLSDDGDIVNGSMTTLSVSPDRSYVGFMKARVSSQLQCATRHGILGGKDGEKAQRGLKVLLQSKLACLIDPWEANWERTLVHGDFCECSTRI
jgi:hypothetical protein